MPRALAKPRHEYDIHETPDVCRGYPCIGDTRFPVRGVVEVLRAFGTVNAVAAYFAQLTRTQIEEALAYYRDHLAQVDEHIRHNAEAGDKSRSHSR